MYFSSVAAARKLSRAAFSSCEVHNFTTHTVHDGKHSFSTLPVSVHDEPAFPFYSLELQNDHTMNGYMKS